MKSPVLFLVFNRPETTVKVFDAIKGARPPKLYVVADGPRANVAGEAGRCAEVRAIVGSVDWPCEVHTLFRDANLGCKAGVSSGIAWFFSQEPEGIILEDDVLPLPSFFDYCDELLERYRDDDRIGMVSGCNLVADRFRAADSYFFSRYNHIWGWASWRRAWQHYDLAMSEWPAWRDGNGLARVSDGRRLFESYWRDTLNNAYEGRINTWDYQWTFACWRMGYLGILPAANQTRNLGFGADATHTTAGMPEFLTASPPRPLRFPLTHPAEVRRQGKADNAIDTRVYGISAINALKRRMRAMSVFAR